jgi:hypothetical protein
MNNSTLEPGLPREAPATRQKLRDEEAKRTRSQP